MASVAEREQGVPVRVETYDPERGQEGKEKEQDTPQGLCPRCVREYPPYALSRPREGASKETERPDASTTNPMKQVSQAHQA